MMSTKPRFLHLIAAAGVILLSGCHHRPTIEKSSTAEGEARHPLDRAAVVAPGIVEPWSGEVRLASTEPGQLAELLVVEGQQVRKGDLLARLEDSQQRHAVVIAEAELRQASALLEGMTSTGEELRTAMAELLATDARAEQQRRESKRAASLGESGVLSNAEVERAASAARVGEATRDAAAARLAAVKRGARPSDRQFARARREAVEARLSDARAALARREVRATIDGVVMWSRYHVGEFYTQTQGPLFVLGDTQHLQVRLEADDGDAALLVAGARCKLRDDAGKPLAEGTVVRIAVELGSRSLPTERPSARTDARVREVFVEVDAATPLGPGQRVWGHVSRGTLHATH